MENIMSSKLFTTRQGTVLLGVGAAVIAAIALIVYLNSYRNSVNKPPIQVLVAQKLIQQGTPGDTIRTSPGLYSPTSYARGQVETGAITDPATLSGKVATVDIAPGQQLTAADFGTDTGINTQLHPGQRAVVVPLGSPQAVGGQISTGSHVDVWVSSTSQSGNGANRPTVRLLFQNMYVMNSGTDGGNVTLKTLTPTQAGQLIYAAQNAEIWLVLRPTIGTITKPPVIGASSVTGR